jgi:peptide chain release factor 3
MDLSDASIRDQFDADNQKAAVDELALIEAAGANFDQEMIHRGKLTPVYFGSAMNNFGVQMLLDSFVQFGSAPQPQPTESGMVQPIDPKFSGFVFKIQANMDPRHRDRIVYVRVCSGKFEREMSVVVERTGKRINVNSSHRLFGQERETIDEAWPGDIIGIIGQNSLRIGDTLSASPGVKFKEFPQFAAEVFIYLHNDNPSQFKRFRDGLDQLLQEGVVQVIQPIGGRRVPLLGAVGVLQFDVVQYRLKSEYGADSRIENTTWTTMRWIDRSIERELVEAAAFPTGSQLATDQAGRLLVLFESEWAMRYFLDQNPKMKFATTTG